jgi:hypothetical protein
MLAGTTLGQALARLFVRGSSEDRPIAIVSDERQITVTSSKPIVIVAPDIRIISDGSVDVISAGDQHMLTGGVHHTNPGGGGYYDERMSRPGDPPWIRDLMVRRDSAYRCQSAISARREFYVRAARNALRPKRRGKFGGGCGCHH